MSGAWLRSPIETIVALGRSRGFVFPSGEIYGGERSAWDFGPLGVELKNNVKRQWWKAVVNAREDVVGMDSAVVLPRETWFASGHADAFTAPLVECTSCSKRFDADRLAEERRGPDPDDPDDLDDVACPHCGTRGRWTEPRPSPLLMLTGVGPIECDEGLHHLRPETVQGAFLNFLNVQTTSRIAPPFGIGQIGRSFRNEIATGTFLFRSREFEQMELAYFVEPGSDEELHQYWIDERTSWYADLGIARENLRHRERPKERLAHYAKRSVDIEYRYGFSGQEWGEVEGVANRTDADMLAHSNRSGVELSFYDRASASRWTPYVIGPSAGVERAVMAFLLEACAEDEVPNAVGGTDHRVVLRLDPRLAPVKAAVLPLSRNADLTPAARDLAAALRRNWNVEFDDAGALGRRYRRQDEIGTPFCVTVDFDSLADHAVTVRERDSLATERVGIDRVETYLATRLVGC